MTATSEGLGSSALVLGGLAAAALLLFFLHHLVEQQARGKPRSLANQVWRVESTGLVVVGVIFAVNEFRALVAIAGLPGRVDPALALEPVQRGIERAVVDVQHVLGAGAERHADPVAVLRSPLQRAEDQQIERALQQFRLLTGLRHR